MADTKFGTNDPRTQKKWSKKAFKYALQNMFLTRRGFMGTGPDSIVQVDKDLTKGIGDKVTFELLVPLAGQGQGDHGTMVGNSEEITVMNFPVEVHERLHSVQSGGPLSEKRTSTNIRDTGKVLLGTWKAQILENDIMRALSGLYNVSTAISTINEKTPSTGRIYYGGQTTAGVVSTATMTTDALLSAETIASTLFGTKIIGIIKRRAMACIPKIRPIMWNGQEYYRMLIHPLQAKSLKAEAAWNTAQQQANVRGLNNPIFSGALGVWDGVIIEEYDRIQTRLGAGGTAPEEGFTLNAARTATSDAVATGRTVARGMLLGAQACALAWGKMPTWREDPQDAGRKPVIGTDMIYGVSKTRFRQYDRDADTNTDQKDYGVYLFDNQVNVD